MKPALSQEVQFVQFSISICFNLATLLDRVAFSHAVVAIISKYWKPDGAINSSGVIFPYSSVLKWKTRFLLDDLPVLNFHGKKHQYLEERRNNFLKKQNGKIYNYLFNSFHCFTRCSSSQHHSPSMPKIYSIPLLFTGSFAIDNAWWSLAVDSGDYLWSGIICGAVHFRVPKTLTFKTRLRAKLYLWKWVAQKTAKIITQTLFQVFLTSTPPSHPQTKDENLKNIKSKRFSICRSKHWLQIVFF